MNPRNANPQSAIRNPQSAIRNPQSSAAEPSLSSPAHLANRAQKRAPGEAAPRGAELLQRFCHEFRYFGCRRTSTTPISL
jgi:hypothetical protein